MTTPVSHTVTAPGGGEIKIIGITDNLDYFTGGTTPDTIGGVVNTQIAAGGGSRRQYPGDASTIAVAGHNRRFMKDPSRRSSNALPGRPFVLQEITSNGPGERRQFRHVGSFIALHAWLSSELQVPAYLYSSRGARYTLDGPAT